jgi:hypothetical protein
MMNGAKQHKGVSGRAGFRPLALRAALAAFFALGLAAAPDAAYACTNCSCVDFDHDHTRFDAGPGPDRNGKTDQHHQAQLTREQIQQEFVAQEYWELNTMWLGMILPELRKATDQLVDVAMAQAFAVGTMIDSKQEIETQRTLDELTAKAQRDYQISTGMCIIGTNMRSLAMAERRGEFNKFAMLQRSQDRQMGHRGAIGADGMHYDLRSRMATFKTTFCNNTHWSGNAKGFCPESAKRPTRDADINFTQTVDQPQTLDIDFTDQRDTVSADETSVFALADNLYANNLLTRLPETNFFYKQNREKILDLRALIAKRSVAENSFYSIVGMKSDGSVQPSTAGLGNVKITAGVTTPQDGDAAATQTNASTATYMKVLLKQMGVPDGDMDRLIGFAPSYYAQMNVLTKTLYQRPEFYTDLYDTPANVERKSTAMMAIQLMQNFDQWESNLRQEAMLSVWLELDLKKYQETQQNNIDRLQARGVPANGVP